MDEAPWEAAVGPEGAALVWSLIGTLEGMVMDYAEDPMKASVRVSALDELEAKSLLTLALHAIHHGRRG